jgi:hypothetical protein
VSADAQEEPEVFTQVLKELCLVVQAKRSSSFQQDFNLVTAIRILVMSFHQPCVNLSIRVPTDSLQHNDDGNEELLLFVQDTQVDVAVSNIMKRKSFCIEVISNTTHLHCELSVARASVGVRGSQEGHWVVTFLDDQHTHHFLVAVYDEVAAEFVRVFVQLYQLLLVDAAQVTAVGANHDGDFSQGGGESVSVAVDFASDDTDQWS